MKLLRLSLRELFLLVALVGMGLGWWVDHRRQWKLEGRCDALTKAVNQLDGGFYTIRWYEAGIMLENPHEEGMSFYFPFEFQRSSLSRQLRQRPLD